LSGFRKDLENWARKLDDEKKAKEEREREEKKKKAQQQMSAALTSSEISTPTKKERCLSLSKSEKQKKNFLNFFFLSSHSRLFRFMKHGKNKAHTRRTKATTTLVGKICIRQVRIKMLATNT
jgi:hypothetical protein